jgi:hypothetical protein
VNDADAVRVRDRGEHLEEDVDRLLGPHRAEHVEVIGEVPSRQELHHDRVSVGNAARRLAVRVELEKVEDVHDGAMPQIRRRACLAPEAFDVFDRLRIVRVSAPREQLHADFGGRRSIRRDPQLRHPAETGGPFEDVLPREENARSCFEREHRVDRGPRMLLR